MKYLDQKGVNWFLTVLGGVTTTQREYIALHILQQFHPKVGVCLFEAVQSLCLDKRMF
jgi:hypothetical protein